MLSACVLIRTSYGRWDDVVESIRKLTGIKRVFSVLGRYDVVVDLEASDIAELSSIVLRMGKFAGVVFTETLIEVQH